MDHKFTREVQAWLEQPAAERDYEKGAMYLLQLSNNRIMYNSIIVNPKRRADFIVHQLKKYVNFRLQSMTHDEVMAMQKAADEIVKEHSLDAPPSETAETVSASTGSDDGASAHTAADFRNGMRPDHDTLPLEIQGLYVENASIMKKMRDIHAKLRMMNTQNATCPDSERYPFLKELIELDKRYHYNWKVYDTYSGGDSAEVAQLSLEEEERQREKNIIRQINLTKGRYKKAPSDKLKEQILELYSQLTSPVGALTAELQELGIIEPDAAEDNGSAEEAETEASTEGNDSGMSEDVTEDSDEEDIVD